MYPVSARGALRPRRGEECGERVPGAPAARRDYQGGEGSALHAERALVELQLAVDADLLVEIVPAVEQRP